MITQDMSGLQALQQRIRDIQAKLQTTMQDAVNAGANKAIQRFSQASPVGTTEGNTIPGDAPGKLKDSYRSQEIARSNGAGVSVYTVQSIKLGFILRGTGLYGPLHHRIYPLRAKALYWQGAAHPYRSVAGMKPNDFVTPVQPLAKQDIRETVKEAMSQLLGSL
jgi:hypothetical protein